MKKFLKSLLVYLNLYKAGFFFSDNSHKENDNSKWGFYRLNYEKREVKEYSLFDIDFADNMDESLLSYYHLHTYKTIFRIDWRQKQIGSKEVLPKIIRDID